MVLHERLNRAQWLAVALAAIGVLYLTVATAHPPWIALVLAASFGTYGLIRKVVKVESVPGSRPRPCCSRRSRWRSSRGRAARHRRAGARERWHQRAAGRSGLITALRSRCSPTARADPVLDHPASCSTIGPTLQFLIGGVRVPRGVHGRARRGLS